MKLLLPLSSPNVASFTELVLLGTYHGVVSPNPAPSNMDYGGVNLQAGETWRFEDGQLGCV